MAYLYKAEVGQGAYSSPLAQVDFSRQRDVFRLARMGNADCKRLWCDFETEVPGMARLVVADVLGEDRESAKAAKSVDKRLRQAETLTKGIKPKKPKKAKAQDTGSSLPAFLGHLLTSPDPKVREAAGNALNAWGKP